MPKPMNWLGDSAVLMAVAYERFCGQSKENLLAETCRKRSLRSATISLEKTNRGFRFSVSRLVISLLRKPARLLNKAQHDHISVPEFGYHGLRRICGRSICGRRESLRSGRKSSRCTA